jgi:ribosomal protein S13
MTYGSKKSSHYRHTRIMARVASVRARRLEEERGLLLDAKKQFRMELKRNQGIGWYRSLQICKHLEMHERGKGPVITEATRDKITQIANMVKLGK